MKNLFLLIVSTMFFCLLALMSCKDKENDTIEMEVRYIDQICCGNMMVQDSTKIAICEYGDWLLRAENLDELDIADNYEFGDVIRIEFLRTGECEAVCDIICNRWNGIPIEIISILD